MIEADAGSAVPVELMLPDGKEDKFVRAFLQKDDGTDLGFVDLVHMRNGRYAASHTFTDVGYVFTDYIVYSDSAHTLEDLYYTRTSEVYRITPAIDQGGSFASIPAAVWNYPTRLITNDFSALATAAELDQLATRLEGDLTGLAKSQYANNLTTTFDTITGEQEILVWCEKDGVLVHGGACSVSVRNAAGSIAWQQTTSTPSSDGVYRFINPITAPGSANYYVLIGIYVDGATRTNIKTFFTVA